MHDRSYDVMHDMLMLVLMACGVALYRFVIDIDIGIVTFCSCSRSRSRSVPIPFVEFLFLSMCTLYVLVRPFFFHVLLPLHYLFCMDTFVYDVFIV